MWSGPYINATINGFRLLHEDAWSGEIRSLIDKRLNMIHRADAMSSARTLRRVNDDCCVPRRAIPSPNFPPEPNLKLNEMFIPIGMQRWSKAHLLVDQKTLEKIQGLQNNTRGKASPSKLEVNNTILNVWMSGYCQIGVDENLYLITVVDSRYFAQFTPMPELNPLYLNWPDLFTKLRQAFQASPFTELIPNESPGYFQITHGILGEPDRRYFDRPGESAAMIYDQARWSLYGEVFKPRIFSFTSAIKRIAAADSSDAVIRSSLAIYFTKMVGGKVRCDLPPYILSYGNPSEELIKVIHSSEYAIFDTIVSPTPSNASFLDSILAQMDPVVWEETGRQHYCNSEPSDDYVKHDLIWSFNQESPGLAQYQARGIHELYLGQVYLVQSQRAPKDCSEDNPIVRFELTEVLPVGGTALAKRLDCDCNQSDTITITDIDHLSHLRRGIDHTGFSPVGATGAARVCGSEFHLISIGMGNCETHCPDYEAGLVYACKLTQVGGYPGNCEDQCSFRYDVRNLDDLDLALNVDLNDTDVSDWQRQAKGRYREATRGTFYVVPCDGPTSYPTGGAAGVKIRISWCNEVPEISTDCGIQVGGVMLACEENCKRCGCTSSSGSPPVTSGTTGTPSVSGSTAGSSPGTGTVTPSGTGGGTTNTSATNSSLGGGLSL